MTSSEIPNLEVLIKGDLQDWLSVLPGYQQSLLEEMLRTQEPAEAAIAWLTSTGPKDTAPFGGVRVAATLFYENLLAEVQKLLCGGEGYRQEREQLRNAGTWTNMVIVSFVSTSIAPHVGAAAVVIGPVVAIVLALLSKSGKATICDGLSSMIQERTTSKTAPEAKT